MALLSTFDRQQTKRKNPKGLRSEKIGLMGPFGGGNLGDAAIQKSMIDNLRQLNPQIEVYGFSLKPEDTASRHGIITYPINKAANSMDYLWWKGKAKNSLTAKLTNLVIDGRQKSSKSLLQKIGLKILTNTLELLAWLRAYKNLKQLNLDLFIVSGGGQLDDYWRGAWGHPFTLLRWCLMAKLSNTPFLIVSVGAAPINQTLSKLFTRITLSLASYRSYRDEDSKKYIEKIVGFKKNDPVYADLAFSLPTDSYQKSLCNIQHKGIVGVGPMSYCNPQSSWPEKNERVYQEYLHKLSTFAVWLTQQNYALALFPGQTAHDQLAIADFKALLKRKNVADEQIVERSILTVDELMSQLVDLDFVVASRFHGVLLSLLMNKPLLALSYHRKISMLMTNTGQSEYCLWIDNFEVETMKDKFDSISKNHRKIRNQLAIKTQEYQFSLAKQYDYIFRNF